MPLSEEEFVELLSSPESERIERKRDLSGSASRTIREAICAFSNDLAWHGNASYLIVGLDDAGVPSGMPVSADLLKQLADIRYEGQIVPPPVMFVEQSSIDGFAYALVTVLPADSPPVRYQSRICVRIGPRRGYADAQEERILNERRRFRDRPFDVQPDVLAENERTLE